jgi:hypothetical protein
MESNYLHNATMAVFVIIVLGIGFHIRHFYSVYRNPSLFPFALPLGYYWPV